jgi:hypothetical protein
MTDLKMEFQAVRQAIQDLGDTLTLRLGVMWFIGLLLLAIYLTLLSRFSC